MVEETPIPAGGVPPEPDASPAPAEGRRSGRPWAWALVVLCAAFVAVQLAGVLLRDRLERRTLVLGHAPSAEPGTTRPAAPGPAPVGEASPRFGPDVAEVVVTGPGPGAAGEPSAAPAAPTAAPAPAVAPPAPQPAASVKAPAPAPRPAAVKPAAAAPGQPPAPTPVSAVRPPPVASASPKAPEAAAKPHQAEAGTHALLVDVFLSQRYLRETEAKLSSLGVPHLRTEILRQGKGYRVAVQTPDEAVRKAARTLLDRGGTAYRTMPSGLEVFVYYRDEAQQLADVLGKAGAQVAVEPVDGERPFWRLYAGPFSEDEARRVRKVLAAKGIRTSLEVRP